MGSRTCRLTKSVVTDIVVRVSSNQGVFLINIIHSNDRYHADFGWLSANWHFSFGDYHDPKNMGWGPLRVFNDDVIGGGGGFDAHPHRDMEIVTYVLDGALEHSDNLGHLQQLKAGEVQVMSAGKGIVHAEFNASKTDAVHLIQLWIMPKTRGLTPRYEQRTFGKDARTDKLLPVASGRAGVEGVMPIDQDATVYVSRVSAGQSIEMSAGPGRKAYLFDIEGTLSVNGQDLNQGDQARTHDEAKLVVTATGGKDAELILLDLPA